MMALKLGRGRRFSREDGIQLAREIEAIPALVAKVILQSEKIAKIAAEYTQNEHAFFIGRGPMYPVAHEGALKLKEISNIHAEGYHPAVVALQLFAYHVARLRGCEIDQPRNLAKSVTVE